MLLSIITINLNNREGLIRTINSVASQTFQDFEFIAIDGGSTDGSVDVIKSTPRIDYWVSEPDSGIYDAMNKGIYHASGEYCLFLNSGDMLNEPSTISICVKSLNGSDIIYGDLTIVAPNNRSKRREYPPENTLTASYIFRHSLPHPASFIKKALLKKYQSYNSSYKIISDWIFFCMASLDCEVHFKHLDFIVSIHYLDGISHSRCSIETIKHEKTKAAISHFPMLYRDFDLVSTIQETFGRSTTKKLIILVRVISQFKNSVLGLAKLFT